MVSPNLPEQLRVIKAVLKDEYRQPHDKPWLVGYSGGKDSTLVLQLVFETLLILPPSERRRDVVVVSNDTLVESPVVQAYVDDSLEAVQRGADALRLPMRVVQTRPDDDETFWVNLLGRGYPAPNRSFRWCTDRMKIRPTSKVIRDTVAESGESILLLGARRAESAHRARVLARYFSDPSTRLSPHNDVAGCLVFQPIIELASDDVWLILQTRQPPWGGTHDRLVALYRDAQGGECPFVTSLEDAPSCGSSSARFGCWTCTVVEKDLSLAGLIEAGHADLQPLFDFRKRLKAVSADPSHRSKTRRTGQHGLGPFTMEARAMLLEELLDVQAEVNLPLISADEIRRIRAWWDRDRATDSVRRAKRLEAELAEQV